MNDETGCGSKILLTAVVLGYVQMHSIFPENVIFWYSRVVVSDHG